MHLTNYAINKDSENYIQANGKNEFESSKRSFLSIIQLIEREFGIPAAENLQNEIYEMRLICKQMNPFGRFLIFELLYLHILQSVQIIYYYITILTY